jgi:pimeloyl-ACP methyl ester carboxylesterase
MSSQPQPSFLQRPDGEKLAFLHDTPERQKKSLGITWLGGFKSDMTGTKATALAAWTGSAGCAYTRFDYFGHGQSSGKFTDGTITRWRDDALAVLDEIATGPQILVGSSMGAWIALLAALARPEQVKALILIAPAPDFTEALMWEGFDETIRTTLRMEGIYRQPSDYDEPYEISYRLIEDGRKHLLLGDDIPLMLPVRILQGMADTDVPWRHAMLLAETLVSEDVTVALTKDGDHRLSEPDDIKRLMETLDGLLETLGP